MILRPSSAHRWGPGGCPGSPHLEARYPEDTESPAAREGTAAHYYATERLQGRVWPIGTLAPNGHPIDQDMIDGGDLLYETVRAIRAGCSDQARMYVERGVTMHGLIHPQNEGTLDVAIIDFVQHKVFVIDYKYGHRYVEVFRNWQLVDYLAGVIEGAELSREEFIGWSVNAVIVQPRWFGKQGTVRTWSTLGHKFWPELEALASAAERAADPAAPLQTGEHCRDCSARHMCPALGAVSGLGIDLAWESSPAEMSLDAMARENRQITWAIERLEARKTGLDASLTAALMSGKPVPLWGMTRTEGRENWRVPVSQVIDLGDMMGVDLRKMGTLTPNQARKAGLDEAVTSQYAGRNAGEIKLVLLDETTAAKAFS